MKIGGIHISEAKLKALPDDTLTFLIEVAGGGLKNWEPNSKTEDVKKALKILKAERKRRKCIS